MAGGRHRLFWRTAEKSSSPETSTKRGVSALFSHPSTKIGNPNHRRQKIFAEPPGSAAGTAQRALSKAARHQSTIGEPTMSIVKLAMLSLIGVALRRIVCDNPPPPPPPPQRLPTEAEIDARLKLYAQAQNLEH